jgi:hypothetical protein
MKKIINKMKIIMGTKLMKIRIIMKKIKIG